MAGIEEWSDDRVTSECDKVRAAQARAIAEPSAGLPDIQAKARFALCQIEADIYEEGSEIDLAATVLREVIALCA